MIYKWDGDFFGGNFLRREIFIEGNFLGGKFLGGNFFRANLSWGGYSKGGGYFHRGQCSGGGGVFYEGQFSWYQRICSLANCYRNTQNVRAYWKNFYCDNIDDLINQWNKKITKLRQILSWRSLQTVLLFTFLINKFEKRKWLQDKKS